MSAKKFIYPSSGITSANKNMATGTIGSGLKINKQAVEVHFFQSLKDFHELYRKLSK